MGDEADADWQDGLVEWGIEDTRRWMEEQRIQTRHGIPFKKQKKRRAPHRPQAREPSSKVSPSNQPVTKADQP